jgi:phage shock protein PspC (stress-responsive transcriptional regulator)/two-component sensor histidine kinase
MAARVACCDHRAVAAPTISRTRSNRLVGGVASGLAVPLGVDAGIVRVAFLLLAVAGGVGIGAYALLWALVPECEEPDVPPDPRPLESLAVLASAAGAVLVLRSAGVWFSDAIAVPGILAAAGAGLVWGQVGGGRWSRRPRGGSAPARVAVGVSLVLVGAAAAFFLFGGLEAVGPGALGTLVVVGGLGLLLGPAVARLTGDLAAERRERIRSQERADVAAHLHDGVLQTLALIQKRSAESREVRSLARRQERELREWLYGRPTPAVAGTVAELLAAELAAVEDGYGVRLDLVTVGDAPLDDRTRALVLAGREAALNAARHARVDVVDVYLEVDNDDVSLFVRDRGAGFDPARIPDDRRGLADSIRGRIERASGRAVVRSTVGAGTEVELHVPRTVQ